MIWLVYYDLHQPACGVTRLSQDCFPRFQRTYAFIHSFRYLLLTMGLCMIFPWTIACGTIFFLFFSIKKTLRKKKSGPGCREHFLYFFSRGSSVRFFFLQFLLCAKDDSPSAYKCLLFWNVYYISRPAPNSLHLHLSLPSPPPFLMSGQTASHFRRSLVSVLCLVLKKSSLVSNENIYKPCKKSTKVILRICRPAFFVASTQRPQKRCAGF